MPSHVEQLIQIAGPPLSNALPQNPISQLDKASGLADELFAILKKKNGFYAFELALHLFPSSCTSCMDLESWNEVDSWRKGYGEAVTGHLFFAEDLFGGQFSIADAEVYTFDPETGEVEEYAVDLEQWARQILENCDYETGYPMAREWQEKHGPLPVGKRLLPKIPFVLGGRFEVANMYAADAVAGMKFRAEMWRQIRDLPDGTEVRLKIVE